VSNSSPLLRTLVIDDEEPARGILRDLLVTDPEIELIGECVNGTEAVTAIRTHRPDLVFLDIQMPGLDGFGILDQLQPEELPIVIFVTAYDQYAVQAFEVHALDYLLKPFDDERFAEAVARAKATLHSKEVEKVSERLVGLIQDRRDQSARTPNSSPNRLMIRSSGRVYFVKTEDIDWIEAADYYARIHAGGRSHLLRESLASLEEKLDSEQFARVHRSAIVNMDRVKEMRPLFKGSYALILEDGTQLKLSRQRRAELEERLSQSS
jgi:two-component system LytT family response regulator